jgi:hypothetical protein
VLAGRVVSTSIFVVVLVGSSVGLFAGCWLVRRVVSTLFVGALIDRSVGRFVGDSVGWCFGNVVGPVSMVAVMACSSTMSSDVLLVVALVGGGSYDWLIGGLVRRFVVGDAGKLVISRGTVCVFVGVPVGCKVREFVGGL